MTQSTKTAMKTFLMSIAWIFFGSLLLAIILIGQRNPAALTQSISGKVMAPIKAAGWINGKAPAGEDLRGKVLVVEAWATWCLPCRQKVPELVYLHEKYSPEGVVFIGLTDETEENLDAIKEFIREEKVTWLNGYGALETLNAMQADQIPVTWVVDRQGKVRWTEGMSSSIEEAIRAAIASK